MYELNRAHYRAVNSKSSFAKVFIEPKAIVLGLEIELSQLYNRAFKRSGQRHNRDESYRACSRQRYNRAQGYRAVDSKSGYDNGL